MSTVAFLSIALAAIMLSLGLTLTLADFRRVLVYPKAVRIALGCQMLVLPLICLLIAIAFALPPELAVGLMLLSATPGGVTANLFSHLSHGDVALNISLTAINSVLALFTLPLILALSLGYFMAADKVIPPPFAKIVEVFSVVIVPVVVGMVVRARYPQFAARLDKPMRILSALFLVAIATLVITREWRTLLEYFPVIGGAVLTFNLVSLSVGYGAALLARLEQRQAVAIGMEIGIHNATLAMAIAFSPAVLNNPSMAIPGSLYGVLMLFTAAGFGWLVNLRRSARVAA